ncbi:hypothetical protein KAW50_00485 [candidate division WOR-3 bacterium]|nr:hypothetical protein [candidate division WOR-3 bacterium]
MWWLISVLMFTPTSRAMKLANLQGRWTVGLEMDGLFDFDQYSILWRPFKTVMVGIGSAPSGRHDKGRKRRRKCRRRRDSNYEGWNGSVEIGLYKYFRASSSFSPFIALSPGFMYYEVKDERIEQTYSMRIDPGVEYFFGLMGKQLSLRFKTSLVRVSRCYEKRKNYYSEEYNSYVNDNAYFYLPTEGSLSTWLCFHF